MQLNLDGQFVESPPALTSLMLHGYAVFTTFTATRNTQGYWGVKGLSLHHQRLRRDAQALFGLEPDIEEIHAAIRHFLQQCEQESSLILRITLFPENLSIATPESIERLHVLVSGRTATNASPALNVQSIEALRIFPQHKTGNLLVNLKARRMAREAGLDDALLCIDSWIMEGAGWNIFFSDGERLLTPPLTHHLLPGVTRRLITETAQAGGIEVLEKAIHKDRVADYKGAFASNAASGLMPIAAIDGNKLDTNDSIIKRVSMLYEGIEATLLA